MHLVFLNQYYPPDAAPTGVMLAAVAEELAAQGHEVTVICAEGGYANIQHQTLNIEPRRVDAGSVSAVCGEEDPPSAIRVLRIGATRFGRGTFLGKVADYLSYYVGVAWKLMFLKPRPERIVALTTPPYLSVLARVFSKLRGGDHAHWVMDLYPDVMVAHGMLREEALPHRLLAGLARWGFGGKRCAALMTLGPDMAERIAAMVGTDLSISPTSSPNAGPVSAVSIFSWAFRFTGVHGRHSADQGDGCVNSSLPGKSVSRMCKSGPTWIPLWSDAKEEHPTSKDGCAEHRPSMIHDPRSLRIARGWRDDELVVMYSGNMGLGHRFGEILEAMGRDGFSLRPCDLPSTIHNPRSPARYVFFGGGKRRGEIEAFVAEHPDAPVELHDYAAADLLGLHLRSADVHLASLAAEWTGTMVPSKLQGIFQAARPVIFIGDAASSIGMWVAESGGGWLVAPGDVGGLERAIDEARDPQVRESRGRAAKAFAEANFDKTTNVRRVAEILVDALI